MSQGLGSPYAPPASRVETQRGPAAATRGQRFATFYMDSTLLTCSFWGAEVLASAAFGTAVGRALPLVALAVLLGYYVAPEWAFGATPGKLVSGTRVVSADGSRPSLPQVLARTLARLIPAEPLSIFLRRDRAAWHDALSGTRVIRRR